MSQAYPQFTPVQILEAGQRAYAEGRVEYAAQFFKHLIDHYSDTPEAATARDAMARVNGAAAQPAPPQYAQPAEPQRTAPAAQPGYAATAPANGSLQGVQLGVNGAAGAPGAAANGHHAPGHAPAAPHTNGHAAPANGANGFDTAGYTTSARQATAQQPMPLGGQQRHEPVYGRAPAGDDVAHRYGAATAQLNARPDLAIDPALVPVSEKHYIIGRVISGLLLGLGILGLFAGIVLVYAAFTDPAVFAGFGMSTSAGALMFAGGVFIGSLVALIVAQVATAVFDGADAAADLARLQRFRLGDVDDEEE